MKYVGWILFRYSHQTVIAPTLYLNQHKNSKLEKLLKLILLNNIFETNYFFNVRSIK
jgi:hypothetical protein